MVTQEVDPTIEPGMGTLVSGILTDVQTLLSHHLTLLQQELQGNVAKIQKAAYPLVLGLTLVVVAGVTLSAAIALGLHEVFPGFPLGASFGLIGVLWCLVAAGLVLAGKKEIDSFRAAPEKTIQAVKEDVRWLMKK